MLIKTIYTCSCGDRGLWDTEKLCYMKHQHGDSNFPEPNDKKYFTDIAEISPQQVTPEEKWYENSTKEAKQRLIDAYNNNEIWPVLNAMTEE